MFLRAGFGFPCWSKAPELLQIPSPISPRRELISFPLLPASPGSRAYRRGLRGGSLLPILKSGGTGVVKRSREGLFFHFPHYDFDNGGPASAIVLGSWKLIKFYETGSVQLYDIAKDPVGAPPISPSLSPRSAPIWRSA